jgi:hypothetical protein
MRSMAAQKLALAIRWSDAPGSIGRIARLGGVTLHGRPQEFQPQGGLVAVVQKNGAVTRIFESKSIVGPQPVILANGIRSQTGYVLVAKPKTLRVPPNDRHIQLKCRWYAIGQFRYFNPRTWRTVLVTDSIGDGRYLNDDGPSDSTIPFVPYRGGIPGRPRSTPEAVLVSAYVTWMRQPERFRHHYLRSQQLHTDLFDRSSWRVIEAKATTNRVVLRTAVGQLLDYRRCYLRHPTLAVLLPSRPSDSDLDYLESCKVTAIWCTPSGRFSDSSSDRRFSTPIR